MSHVFILRKICDNMGQIRDIMEKNVVTIEYDKSAIDAGILKNKLNSKALFWINKILSFFLDWICFESWGNMTTPIAIPAIAKLIW